MAAVIASVDHRLRAMSEGHLPKRLAPRASEHIRRALSSGADQCVLHECDGKCSLCSRRCALCTMWSHVLVGCGAAHPASSRGQIPKWLALAHWPWSPPHASSHAVPQRACDMAREREAQGERASPNDLEHGGFPVAPHAAPILYWRSVLSYWKTSVF